jgi:hypothetical protein
VTWHSAAVVVTVVEKGGFKNDRMMVSILQTHTVCLPTANIGACSRRTHIFHYPND